MMKTVTEHELVVVDDKERPSVTCHAPVSRRQALQSFKPEPFPHKLELEMPTVDS